MIACPDKLSYPKRKSDRYFVHLAERQRLNRFLAYLLPGRKAEKKFSAITNHDERAALVCALTALCVAIGDFTAVGDDSDGWIILPPRRKFAAWAWKALEQNVERENVERERECGELREFCQAD